MRSLPLLPLSLLILSAGLGGGAEESATGSPAERIARRDFPSIFQAWNPADNLPNEDIDTTRARRDLIFDSLYLLDLAWNRKPEGLADGFTEYSLPRASAKRAALLEKNPNLILLCEIRYRDAHDSFLPEDHPWWKRNEEGKRVIGWKEGGYFLLDFDNPEFRKHIAKRAAAVVRAGYDGVMLDWWEENDSRVELLKTIREAIGDDALILVNANDHRIPRSAKLVNGLFMECWRSKTPEDWKRITGTLKWAEKTLREPRINCLEIWFDESRHDLARMRAATTLSLTLSDGYCLFSDPNDLPSADHRHDWYPFWDEPLGKPLSSGSRQADGSFVREFDNGLAVHNPPGNQKVSILFPEVRRRASDGSAGRRFELAPTDGDFFLKELP